MPGERDEYHPKDSLQITNRILSDLSISQGTWPLSRRGVGLNRLFHAEGSAVLLLRQQHTLIHSSSKIVYMAAGELKEILKKELQTAQEKKISKFEILLDSHHQCD